MDGIGKWDCELIVTQRKRPKGQSFSPFFFGCPVRMGQMGQNLVRARPGGSEGQVVGQTLPLLLLIPRHYDNYYCNGY